MLSLRSISREEDVHFANSVQLRAISFGTEVPQDDAETVGTFLLTGEL